MVKPELGFIWSVIIRVKRMVVDQIDTDGGRGLRLCSVPPTRCNRLPLGHRTRREPEVVLLELASPASALTDAVGWSGHQNQSGDAEANNTMVAWTMSLVVTFVFLLLLVQYGNSIARCNLFPAPRWHLR